MSINKPRGAENGIGSYFRKAVQLVLISSAMTMQADASSYKDPYEGWDNFEYLYEGMDPSPIQESPSLKDDKEKNDFDILDDPYCTEDTCKYG